MISSTIHVTFSCRRSPNSRMSEGTYSILTKARYSAQGLNASNKKHGRLRSNTIIRVCKQAL